MVGGGIKVRVQILGSIHFLQRSLVLCRGGRERHTSHSKMRMSVGHSVTPVAVH